MKNQAYIPQCICCNSSVIVLGKDLSETRQVQLVKLCTVVSRNFTAVSCRRALDSVVHEELSCISLIHNFGGLIFYGYYFSLALTTFNLTFVC